MQKRIFNAAELRGAKSNPKLPADKYGIKKATVSNVIQEENNYVGIIFDDGKFSIKHYASYPIEQYKDESQEDFLKRQERELRKIVPLLELVCSDEEFEQFEGDTKQFLDKAYKILNDRLIGMDVNVKTIPDTYKNIYAKVPIFGRWIEKFEENTPSTLTYSEYELKQINKYNTKEQEETEDSNIDGII